MTAPTHPADSVVRFVMDGKVVAAPSLPPTTTVLDFLREWCGRTGTKEGCAEGDCGACTVVLGELNAQGDALQYRAINSCIRFLPTLDGKELVSVESLQDGAQLHPVQQAMVDCHASQCGFCTPGFVMSLFALYQQDAQPTRATVVDTLSGNLCRCTGYRSIIDAGCDMNRHAEPARWSRRDAQSAARVDMLTQIQRTTALTLPGFIAPRSLDEMAAALSAAPNSLLLAGGTDVGLWVTKHLRDLPPLIYLGEVAELKHIELDAAGLRIGAAVSLRDAWAALVRQHPVLAEQARRFASPPVQNSGTLCGNLANGSPIGDAMPALIALNAQLELRKHTQVRHLPLEAFYLGYQRKDLAPGEFVSAVRVPPPEPQLRYGSYKISKRIDQDIAAVSAGFAVAVDNGRITGARLAFGGMAAIPARAAHAEAALQNQPWSAASIDLAIAALAQDFQPLTDLRASHQYRLRSAGNLLKRFFLEHSQTTTPVRTAAAS